MAKTVLKTRRVLHQDVLDMLTSKSAFSGTTDDKPADSISLAELLLGINDQVKPLLYMYESIVPDLTVNVSPATIQNSQTQSNKTLFSNPDFSGATINFPVSAGGNITPSVF